MANEAKLRTIENTLQLTKTVQSEPVTPVRVRTRDGKT